jgi:hypothetical protein
MAVQGEAPCPIGRGVIFFIMPKIPRESTRGQRPFVLVGLAKAIRGMIRHQVAAADHG